MLTDFISLIYPETCLNCNESLISAERFICTLCKTDLPVTNDHLNKENELFQKFAFEPLVKCAMAYLYFHQDGVAQKLLHGLKYQGKPEIGETLGQWFATELQGHIEPDIIVPVPIHRSKLNRRGYNQSLHFASGLSNIFGGVPVAELVQRVRKTKTQTNRSKVERWENVNNIYSSAEEDLTGLKVLVVDDVITTGATIGMLCERLKEANAHTLYVAAIARGR